MMFSSAAAGAIVAPLVRRPVAAVMFVGSGDAVLELDELLRKLVELEEAD